MAVPAHNSTNEIELYPTRFKPEQMAIDETEAEELGEFADQINVTNRKTSSSKSSSAASSSARGGSEESQPSKAK